MNVTEYEDIDEQVIDGIWMLTLHSGYISLFPVRYSPQKHFRKLLCQPILLSQIFR